MNKLRHSFLGIVLVAAFAAAPATMAEDFHALSQLSTGFTAMPEDQLASIEGTGPNTCVASGTSVACSGIGTGTGGAGGTATATGGAGGSVTFNNPAIVISCTLNLLGLIVCLPI